MKGDLIINNQDAWDVWGVNMGDGFLDAIDGFAPMKDYIDNDSRLEHGRRVLVVNPRVASRDLTLHFTIMGSNEAEFRAKRKSFEAELRKGFVEIIVPALGEDVYRLVYTGKSVSYNMSRSRCFCTFSSKFEEPNTMDRAPRN